MSLNKLHVIHYIESLGIGGGQSMLFEFNYAIQKYYPLIQQYIWLANKEKITEEFVKSYGIEYFVVPYHSFSKCILDMKEPVIVIYHKLMSSQTEIYRPFYKKVPIITINHTYSPGIRYRNISKCDYIVSVSKHMKSIISKFSAQSNHTYIRNGINQERYQDIQPIKREYKNSFVTGRINCLNKIKYSESWLKWCLGLNLDKRLIHEYMGEGQFFNNAKSFVEKEKKKKRKHSNKIVLLGNIKDFEKKVSIIKNWDVFLYETNRHEGISIAILEALACGVPVICSNHYGNKEIIKNGVNGYIFKDRNQAEKILKQLSKNPAALAALKVSTLNDFSQNLDARYMVKKYVKLLHKLCQKYELKVDDFCSDPVSIASIPKETKEKPMNVEVVKEKEKFSILTAGRNSAKYVTDWANSILQQKYRPLEVVYIDDCSNDRSWENVIAFHPQFKNAGITFKMGINEKRFYCGTSYYNAWEKADGFYFGILDVDDALKKEAVEKIVKVYNEYKNITHIYTQFELCDSKLKKIKRGFCCSPSRGKSLLDLGDKRIHAYSHWRTFSKRHPKLQKIFGRGLRAGVDKYMGYRLEEFGKGMFWDRVLYKYRSGLAGCISKTEPAIPIWDKIRTEARSRRKRYNLKPFEIIKQQ